MRQRRQQQREKPCKLSPAASPRIFNGGSSSGGGVRSSMASNSDSCENNSDGDAVQGAMLTTSSLSENCEFVETKEPIITASTMLPSVTVDSQRSWKSFISDEGYESRETSTPTSSRPSSVHGNLMRSRKQRDPKRYYQVVEILGEGSMVRNRSQFIFIYHFRLIGFGSWASLNRYSTDTLRNIFSCQGSVAKVKKRPEAIGGSSKQEYVKKEKGCCFVFLTYLNIPSLMPKFDQLAPLNSSDGNRTSSKHGSLHGGAFSADQSHHSYASKSSTPRGRAKQMVVKRSSSQITYGGAKKGGTYFALKSIHLDRCTTPEYVKELRNEGTSFDVDVGHRPSADKSIFFFLYLALFPLAQLKY